MALERKVAPNKFKGDLKKTPLNIVLNYISFSCVLSLKNKKDTGALYFKNGELVNARINNTFNIDKAKELLNWKEGEFIYQKWTRDFEIEYKQLSDILHFIEINSYNTELSFLYNGKITKIFCSEGVIVGIEPNPIDIKSFFKDILEETKGNIKIKDTGAQIGDLKGYFSEIISQIKNNSSQNKSIKKTNKKPIQKTPNKEFDNKIIDNLLVNLKEDLKDELIAASFYCANTGKMLNSFNANNEQTNLFVKLHKTVNKLLVENNKPQLKDYFLMDLENNYLIIIIIFKNHHFGLALDSSKVKLGYIFNVVKPLITNYYKMAIENKI